MMMHPHTTFVPSPISRCKQACACSNSTIASPASQTSRRTMLRRCIKAIPTLDARPAEPSGRGCGAAHPSAHGLQRRQRRRRRRRAARAAAAAARARLRQRALALRARLRGRQVARLRVARRAVAGAARVGRVGVRVGLARRGRRDVGGGCRVARAAVVLFLCPNPTPI